MKFLFSNPLVVSAAGLISGVLVFGELVVAASPPSSYHRHFDSASWKTAAWESSIKPHTSIRIGMVDDLLQRYRLVGMSRAQIVKLLGEADPGNPTDSESFYYLGPERSVLSIDNEWLKIKFHDEVVTSAEDYTD